MQDRITIRQVVTAWGRDTGTGSRAAVLRLRYRARGGDWGHAGARKFPLRIAHPTLTGDQLAVAGICVRLIPADPGDEVYLAVSGPVADLLRGIQATGTADWMPETLHDVFQQTLPLIRNATIEVHGRRSLRDLHKAVADSRPDSSFQSLEQAVTQTRASLAEHAGRPEPVQVTEPGWTCDWGYSRKYEGAAIGLVRTGHDGNVVGTPLGVVVPTPPDLADGELAGVLLAHAYARLHGEACRVVYSDARDTADHLRQFVAEGRPAASAGLLVALAAPFTDEELLGIQVRWVYRHSTRAHRAADAAARHLSRREPAPAEGVLDLDGVLAGLASQFGDRPA